MNPAAVVETTPRRLSGHEITPVVQQAPRSDESGAHQKPYWPTPITGRNDRRRSSRGAWSVRGRTPTDPKETAEYSRKPIVGLAGGIGSGKSVVASLLSELGAGVIDSDALSHEEINKPDVRDTLHRWWGPSVVSADGTVDRKVIGGMVFADPLQRHRLEALLHPRIAVRRSDLIEEMQRQPRIRLIVLDSPLLYEADLDLVCDAVIFVEADFETRAARAASVRGWTGEELRRREATQSPLEMKRARADYVCVNNADLDALRRSVRDVFERIMAPRRVP